MRKSESWILALLFAFFIGNALFILHVVVDHEPALVKIVEPRPEFGTLPPDCTGLEHNEWCECMGVPYR